MSDFLIEVGEEFMETRPWLSWNEVMNRINKPRNEIEKAEIDKIKTRVFNRSYNK